MLTSLGHEDDGADALDLDGGRVLELDGATDVLVQLGEDISSPNHVVHGAAVEVPAVDLVVARAVAKEGIVAWHVEVEGGERR